MTFYDCVIECAGNKDLVAQFNRLNGTNIGVDPRKPIERMIDEATGHEEEIREGMKAEFRQFIAFCWDVIWMPLAAKA